MDLSLKPCTKLWEEQHQTNRLSTLPHELLIRILSLLPTKYAVVVCFLLKKWEVLPWITSHDFDASPICHCLRSPNQIERFPSFQTFVDSVLQAHQSPYLTCFRLNVGVDFYMSCVRGSHFLFRLHRLSCHEACFPDLKATQVTAWISFPLTHCGLRVLELSIHVRGPPGQSQLPPEVFMKETLEVLKLDVNLSFDGITIFRLPNLKTLHLNASIISEDAFLTNLVSSCPLLEELKVSAWWNHVHFTKISSPSLQRLSLFILKLEDDDNSDLVVLDTPNLEYLKYLDNLASQYSITSMSQLAIARIDFSYALRMESLEIFITHIKKKQLPVFHNLILLELGMLSQVQGKSFVTLLYRAPNLETLVFAKGFLEEIGRLELEKESRRLTLTTIPWCCKYNLKRIVVHCYNGSEREIMYIQFLLKYSLVLEELVVLTIDPTTLESTLKNLSRASDTCSIQLQCYRSA